jgi:ketosteroid isomerase-like protein
LWQALIATEEPKSETSRIIKTLTVMNAKNIFYVALVLFLISACTQKQVADRVKPLVDSLDAVSASAFNSGDFNKVLDICNNDAVFISYGKKMAGKDSIAHYLKNSIPFLKDFTSFPCLYSVSDKLVFTQSYFTCYWNKDSSSNLMKGTAIYVWQKQDDKSWKMTFFQEDHY